MTQLIVALKGNNIESMKPHIPEISQMVWGFKLNDLIYDIPTRKLLFQKNLMADAKVFEIPEDMENEILDIYCNMYADIITVHISAMFNKYEHINPNILAGVTVLTSMSEADCLFTYNDSRINVVKKFTKFAINNNYGYLVCSGRDLRDPELYEIIQNSTIKTICPGIRMFKIKNDDQSFTITPEEAIELGIDFIVVGRPISQANNPTLTTESIIKILS